MRELFREAWTLAGRPFFAARFGGLEDAQAAAREAGNASDRLKEANDAVDMASKAADEAEAARNAAENAAENAGKSLDKGQDEVQMLTEEARQQRQKAEEAKKLAERKQKEADEKIKAAGDNKTVAEQNLRKAEAAAAAEQDPEKKKDLDQAVAAARAKLDALAVDESKAGLRALAWIPILVRLHEADLKAATALTNAEAAALAVALKAKVPAGAYIITDDNLTNRIAQMLDTVVGKDLSEKVWGNVKKKVMGDVKKHLEKDYEEWIGGKFMTTIKVGKQEHNYGWSHKTVVGFSTETILGKKLSAISPLKTEEIVGAEVKIVRGWALKKVTKKELTMTDLSFVKTAKLMRYEVAACITEWRADRIFHKANREQFAAEHFEACATEAMKLDGKFAGVTFEEYRAEADKHWQKSKEYNIEGNKIDAKVLKLKACSNALVVKK